MKHPIIKKLIVGVLMATFMAALFGCDLLDKKATEPILSALREKYGQEFTVYALGDRLGKNTATAYVYANDDPTMLFTARVTTEGELVFENYAYRTVCRGAEKLVADAFRAEGMDAVSFCGFYAMDNTVAPGTTPRDYIAAVAPRSMTVSLVLRNNGNVSGEAILQAAETLRSQLGDILLGFNVFVLTPEDYDRVQDKVILETQSFDADRLSRKGTEDPFHKFVFQLTKDGPTLSAAEMDRILAGEVS